MNKDIADVASMTGVSRAELVYNWVKEQIKRGNLPPSSRVRESDLATALDVSRTPVREAINRLLSEGQLTIGARGLSVSELDRQQILELYALREFLEGASARFAAQHADPIEIENLRDLIAESQRIVDEPYKQALLNKSFHLAISSAAHNRYVEDALLRMSDSLALISGTTYEMPGRLEDVIDQHLAIVEAISARDPDRAEAAMRDHIRKSAAARMRLFLARIS